MVSIPNQIVSLGGQKYAIPQENLKELVRIPATDVKDRINQVGNLHFVRLRHSFLPLLDLATVLDVKETYLNINGDKTITKKKNIADRRSFQHIAEVRFSELKNKDLFFDRNEDDTSTNAASTVNIAIVHSEGYKYGLIVDNFYDSEEIEILPIGRYLSISGRLYLGTTILKNKKAALVLDIHNIARLAELSLVAEKSKEAVNSSASGQNLDAKNYSLLTFKNSESEHFAVDINAVYRLERFKSSCFEKIGNKEVVKYNGGVLALFELSEILSVSSFPLSQIQEVILFKQEGFLAGLKITSPVDTFDGRLSLDISAFNKPPIKGPVIINGNTTLLVDVPAMTSKIKERFNR